MSARFTSIQLFRGLAAIAVLLHHADPNALLLTGQPFAGGLFRAGEIGVDCFFVLSGFIITFVHGRDLGAPGVLRAYGWRRFARIYPPVFVAMSVFALVAWALGRGDGITWLELAKSYLLVPTDIDVGDYPVLNVAWTLSYEAFFYLVFAAGIVLGRRALVWMLALWTVVVVEVACRSGGELSSLALKFIASPHQLEFIAGCAVAGLCRACPEPPSWRTLGLVFVATLAGLGLKLNYFPAVAVTLRECGSWAVFFGVMLWVAVNAERRIKRGLPSWLTLPGDASYSIYLWHQAFLLTTVLALSRWSHLGVSERLWTSVLVAFLGSMGAYVLIEKPLVGWFQAKFLDERRSHGLPTPQRAGSAA